MILNIEIYATLIITLLSFIVPLLTVLLSLFPEGIKLLTSKYENEIKQSEENIISETNKRNSENGIDYSALEITITSLRKKKADAKNRLEYLSPVKLLYRIGFPLCVSLIAIFTFNIISDQLPRMILAGSSILGLLAGLSALHICIQVLSEVAELSAQVKNSYEQKSLRLLSLLATNTVDSSIYRKK